MEEDAQFRLMGKLHLMAKEHLGQGEGITQGAQERYLSTEQASGPSLVEGKTILEEQPL